MDEWGLVANEAAASGLVVLGSTYSEAAIEMVRGWNGIYFVLYFIYASENMAMDEPT
jgi:hypothetical protein